MNIEWFNDEIIQCIEISFDESRYINRFRGMTLCVSQRSEDLRIENIEEEPDCEEQKQSHEQFLQKCHVDTVYS